ncbi:MAG: GGDEF domain-containing protein [Gammaproteobacteria bacterium]
MAHSDWGTEKALGTNDISARAMLYFGVISQLAAIILLVVLFVLLRRHAGRRAYFNTWSNAWILFAVALTALVVRNNLLTNLLGQGTAGDWWVRLCYFIYQFGKLAFLVLLLRGTLLYVKGEPHPRFGFIRWLWSGVGGFALISVVFSPTIAAVIFWQGLCNVVVYAVCAVAMLTLPMPRRSLGTRTTGIVLAATLVLWLFYLVALLNAVVPDAHISSGFQALMDGPNNYLDLSLSMLLAFGMVLVLFEDTRREIDTAHQELRVAHEQLLRESYLDILTGAYNRRAFNEGIGLEDAKSSYGVLVALDMDNLKDVNDVYGHKHGDALLKHFASALFAGLRPSDKLYRMGGDEFLVVMPRAVASTAGSRVQEIIATAPSLRVSETGALIKLRASAGTAAFTSVEDIEIAVHEADRAMYAFKRAHRHERTIPDVRSLTGTN